MACDWHCVMVSAVLLATACADSSNWVDRVEVIMSRCLYTHQFLVPTEQTQGESDGKDNQVFILTLRDYPPPLPF